MELRRKSVKFILFTLFIFILSSLLFAFNLSDQPVEFDDPNLETAVREELNHYSKPIFKSQLLEFVILDLGTKEIHNLTGIEHFRNLEVLNLRENKISDVEPLKSLSKLQTLDLGYNNIVNLETSNFHKLDKLNLTNLYLDHNSIELDNGTEIRLSDLTILNQLTKLQRLSLVDNTITDLSPLKKLTKLEFLDLSENKIIVLNELEKLTSLKELNLRQNQLQDISAIKSLSALEYLNLHSNPTLQNISALSSLINLETLILRNVPVEDQIEVLKNLTKLQRLNIRNCGIKDVSTLVHLMSQGALQDNPDEGIEAYLDIYENKIPEKPEKLQELNPYWENIHTKYPLTINGSVLDPPEFSEKSGFYVDSFLLTLTTKYDPKKFIIFYTLDGSIPTQDSSRYERPITIESQEFIDTSSRKATIIRARVIEEDGLTTSPTITKTFFVGENSKSAFSLPVISLVTDPGNLYDPDTGIYIRRNYGRRGKKWERPIHLTFFEPNIGERFTDELLFRIHGQTSRNLAQKSLRLYGQNNYDHFETLNYPFFPGLVGTGTGEPVDQFNTLILRNSGNDWAMTFFRDALIQRLMEHTTLDIQEYQPVNVFLNGKYWGMMNIRERMDEYYIENHYNIAVEDIVINEVSNYKDFYDQNPDENEYLSLLKYIRTTDDDEDEIYGKIEEQIDIANFFDNQITYFYGANGDWLENNVKFWKMDTNTPDPNAPYGQDGKWRWMLVDLDSSFINYERNMISLTALEREYTLVIHTLIKNPDYRIQFINRFADLLNTAFLPSRVITEIDNMEGTIEPDMEKHINRWGTMRNDIDKWHANVEFLRQFAQKRPDFVRAHIIEEFNLNGTMALNIKVDPNLGHVKINTIEINRDTPGVENPSNWTGIYFKNIPITLTALPKPGYRFSHWEGVNSFIAKNENIKIFPNSDMEITAIFEEIDTN